MNIESKCCVFVAIFSLCLFSYLFVSFLYPTSGPALWLDIFESPATNFIFTITCSGCIAFIFSNLIGKISTIKTRRPKIGEILISLDLITPEDLDRALKLQRLRTGEILVQSGRLTPTQRDHALKVQKKKHRLIGEILIELGYSTEEDIRWALHIAHRKIGEVLKKMKLISDYDIDCALSIGKTCRIDEDGKFIES